MYEESREYINRLLAKSGVKLGTAKSTAMTAIIELLDENALNGLIKAIKFDYESMQKELTYRQQLRVENEKVKGAVEELIKQRDGLIKQRDELRERINALESDAKEKEFLATINGCCEAEKSRVIAYKAAIEIGMQQLPRHYDDNALAQVIRSASNVAANWMPVNPKEDKNNG